MDSWEPIPVPPKLAWREFTIRYVPMIAFGLVLITALLIWSKRLGPASILGEAENMQAELSSGQTGVLAELKVRTFQQVKAGEQLGRVVGNDPKNAFNLVSPIDGTVTYLSRQAGDKVTMGDPVVTVSGNDPDRIVGFLRQPISFVPTEGMAVDVRTRARDSKGGQATIIRVSPQLAPVKSSLLPGREHSELGLPVIVSVPKEMKIFPGEIVELTIHSDSAKSAVAAK